MEDFSKVGIERYKASNLMSPTNTKVILKTTYFAIKALYHFIVALFCQLWNTVLSNEKRSKSLAGQIALVTGGGNGFGRSLSLELANTEKCHIAVVDMDFEAAKITANVVKSMGQKAFAYKADVSKYEEVVELYANVKRDLGTVDILVNNAGIVPLMSFQERPPEDIERIMNVNVMSHFWMTRLFMSDMIRQRRGHIVAVASGFGLYPCGRGVTYTTSKFAVRGFMMSLNEELSYNNHSAYIKTTTVYPLFMATREELTDTWRKLRLDELYLLLTPEWCAKVAIDGIKNNYEHLTIPKNLISILTVVASFPAFIRKRIVCGLYGSEVPQMYPESINTLPPTTCIISEEKPKDI